MFVLFAILIVLFFLALLAGFIILIIFLVKKSTQRPSYEEILSEKDKLIAKAKSEVAHLETWGKNKSTTISLLINYSYLKGLSKRTAKGKILSLEGEAVAYFERLERGFGKEGYAVAYTTDFNFHFQTMPNGDAFIEYNGIKWGSISNAGEIKNANGQNIGFAKHPVQASIEFGNMIKTRLGQSFFPVQLNGSHLANVLVAPDYCEYNVDSLVNVNENWTNNSMVALVRDPLEDEEIWLKAIALLEISVNGFWFV